ARRHHRGRQRRPRGPLHPAAARTCRMNFRTCLPGHVLSLSYIFFTKAATASISSFDSLSLNAFILVPSTPSAIALATAALLCLLCQSFADMSGILFFCWAAAPLPSGAWQTLHFAV